MGFDANEDVWIASMENTSIEWGKWKFEKYCITINQSLEREKKKGENLFWT